VAAGKTGCARADRIVSTIGGNRGPKIQGRQ